MTEHPNAMPKEEFSLLLQDLSARGLVRISPDIEDFEDIYRTDKIITEDTNEELPKVIITQVAKEFLHFITEQKSAVS